MSQREPSACPSPASDLHTNAHNRGSSCVLTSADLANMTRVQITKHSAYRLQQTCAESALARLVWIFV
jgi:hypothetical protein